MKIGVLTAFSDILPGYSLTGIVQDQLEMIRRAGHHPVFIAMEDFHGELGVEGVEVRAVLPIYHKIDYASMRDLTPEHRIIENRTEEALLAKCPDLDSILTHDVIFTGWHLPTGLALQQACMKLKDTVWMHWIHSVPGGNRDYWRLPENSKLVYPNHTDRTRAAEQFNTWPGKVAVIPHTKDPRTFSFRTKEAVAIVDSSDVLGADIIETFPVAIDRVSHKRLDLVIQIFGNLKKLGRSVRLICLNAWCNVDQHRETVKGLLALGETHGLIPDEELIFSSRIAAGAYEVGVSKACVADLLSISNLHVNPTQSESFGLVVAEAALAGNLLVLNASLPMQGEIAGHANALYFNFGSHQVTSNISDPASFYMDVAKLILHRLDGDIALKAKMHFQKSYRLEAIWAILEGEILSARAAKV